MLLHIIIASSNFGGSNVYLIDEIYFKLRKDEVLKAKARLKKISINTVTDNISKNCWKYDMQFEVVFKNGDEVVVKMMGKKKSRLLVYDKSNIVFTEKFDSFLNMMDNYGADDGIYITTGVFEGKIMDSFNHFFHSDVKLIDEIKFIRQQLGCQNKCNEVFKYGKMNFYKYFPY